MALRVEGFWDEHPAVLTEPRFLDANGQWEDREAKLLEEVFCNEPEPKATAIFRGAVVKKLAKGTRQAPHTRSLALLPAWQEQGLLLYLLKPGQEGGDKNEGKTLEGAAEADHPSEEPNPADKQLAAEEGVQPGAYRETVAGQVPWTKSQSACAGDSRQGQVQDCRQEGGQRLLHFGQLGDLEPQKITPQFLFQPEAAPFQQARQQLLQQQP